MESFALYDGSSCCLAAGINAEAAWSAWPDQAVVHVPNTISSLHAPLPMPAPMLTVLYLACPSCLAVDNEAITSRVTQIGSGDANVMTVERCKALSWDQGLGYFAVRSRGSCFASE